VVRLVLAAVWPAMIRNVEAPDALTHLSAMVADSAIAA
jgi:hypothetical protein